MNTHTYITTMPDKPGAFMAASKIIMSNNGNITRVSYNKAVDFHMLFIEVKAHEQDLKKIESKLKAIGYINQNLDTAKIIVINIKITDKPGAIMPVLEILDKYKINISYLDSLQEGKDYQNFKMGLFMDSKRDIKEILDEISSIYPVEIVDYQDDGTSLDNTIFYIRFGSDIQKLFDLSNEQTMHLINESNRIMQLLFERGENPKEVFSQVLHLAKFISKHKGNNFHPDICSRKITENTHLHTIEPPCGSNIYIFESENRLLFIDTGFAIYAPEMMDIFTRLFKDFSTMKKTILLTHADVDHCGLLSVLKDAEILVNHKTGSGLINQSNNMADYREMNRYCLGYSRLSQIFSNYIPPEQNRLTILDTDTPIDHESLLYLCDIVFEDITLGMYEGSGGHLYGEVLFVCNEHKLIFTGDIFVNIKGFSKELREFNSIAPYLMTSVDLDPDRAKEMRSQVMELIDSKGKDGFLIYGGHGPVMKL